jgi:peptidyl-prolyl cis-trans isomerase C
MSNSALRIACCLATALSASACSKKATEQPAGPAAASPPAAPAVAPASHKQQPGDVLADVDGVKLTRADAEREAAQRLKTISAQIQPERAEEMRQKMAAYVVDQFVIRTLLLNEAKRLDITATDEEVQAELKRVGERLPPGVTVEQVMKRSAVGEEQMREEIVTKIKVEKVFNSRPSATNVTDGEVEAFYAKHGEKLVVPENVRASHILVAFGTNDTDQAKQEKREKAENLRKRLVAGADFAELASANSDCPSKKAGGDLGRFRKGQMVPAFEEAAFGQKTNEVGPVVETRFGYHVIKVLEHNASERLPRERVVEMLRAEKQRDNLKAFVEELRQKARINLSADAPRLPPQPDAALPPAPAPKPAE